MKSAASDLLVSGREPAMAREVKPEAVRSTARRGR